MSTLVEFSIFPLDKGDSVSKYVSEVLEYIRSAGYPYKLSPMGTVIETDSVYDALKVVNDAHELMLKHSNRVYCNCKLDTKKSKSNRILSKVESIEQKIGTVNK